MGIQGGHSVHVWEMIIIAIISTYLAAIKVDFVPVTQAYL